MEGKVAVLGDADFVMPFSALGVDTFTVGQKPNRAAAGRSAQTSDAVELAKEIVSRKYTLVVVAENAARTVEEVFATVQNMPTPCIVIVPFTTEPDGFATRTLGEVLKMATGINILANN